MRDFPLNFLPYSKCYNFFCEPSSQVHPLFAPLAMIFLNKCLKKKFGKLDNFTSFLLASGGALISLLHCFQSYSSDLIPLHYARMR